MADQIGKIAESMLRQFQALQTAVNDPNATLETFQDPGTAEEAKALPLVDEVWAVHSLPPKFLLDGTVEWDVNVMLIMNDEPSYSLFTFIKESEVNSIDLVHESYFKALLGACNKPGGLTAGMLPARLKRPRRPLKILFVAKAVEFSLVRFYKF